MDSNEYDTKEGIERSLSSLDDYTSLIRERHSAGYDRHERLHEFCVLGRYWLDTCGNHGLIISDGLSVIPKEVFPDMPDVMTAEEFLAFTRPRDVRISWGVGGGRDIAQPVVMCPVCERGWTIDDAHECVITSDSTRTSLQEFVGMTIADYERTLAGRTEARYFLSDESIVRNDRFVGQVFTSPSGRERISERGWVGAYEGFDKSYVIQPDDETVLHIRRFYHPVCRQSVTDARTEQSFRMILDLAGFTPAFEFPLHRVQNQYGSQSYRGPWFEFQTIRGKVIVGWRKRVILIDWSGTGMDLTDLFEDVGDTKSQYFVHAWDYQTAIEYLKRLHGILVSQTEPVA